MKVVVVGCGKVGKTVIESMVKEKHEVVAIDSNANSVYEVVNTFDAMGICGNGTAYEKLSEAGVEKCDLFVAVTGSDELNMLACFAAKKMGAKHTVARIRNAEYNNESLRFMVDNLELSMALNPEKITAENIFEILRLPSALKVERFTSRKFVMLELSVKPDSPLDGKRLAELRRNFSEKFLISAILREDKLFIPKGDFVVKGGDKIGLVATPEHAHKVLKQLQLLQKDAKQVIIIGGSKTAYYLTEMLVKEHYQVKIVDKDEERCKYLAENLPSGVTVVCGDGTLQDILLEENVENTDALVSLTGSDEENIIISVYARSKNLPKIITKINGNSLLDIAEGMGLDCVISPKKTVADIIIRYARALHSSIGSKMETLYSVMNGMAEALEFCVNEDFKFTGIPLKQMKIKDNVLIVGIIRNADAFIPDGDDCILAGDKVIIVSSKEGLCDLSDIMHKN